MAVLMNDVTETADIPKASPRLAMPHSSAPALMPPASPPPILKSPTRFS
jgi:hypothetical protein